MRLEINQTKSASITPLIEKYQGAGEIEDTKIIGEV
jgi:hypothetical protein